jgi:hypothetical protein
MTILQEKLITAAKLLLEAQQIAKANGEAYRQHVPENLALARTFETMAYDLKTNHAITIEGIGHMSGCNIPLLIEPQQSSDKDLQWVFRNNPEAI